MREPLRKDLLNLDPEIPLWIILIKIDINMDKHKRPKIHIPKFYYQDFKQNVVLFSLPSRVMGMKRINKLKQEKDKNLEDYNSRFNPDQMFIDREIIRLQNYLDLISCC